MSMFHELMMRKKEQIMYATIKGTLTENDGVFSGFSATNYLEIQGLYDFSKPFEVVLKIKTGVSSSSGFLRLANSDYGLFSALAGSGKNIGIWIKNTDNNYIANGVYTPESSVPYNTDKFVKFVFTGTQYTISLSNDGIIWTQTNTINNSTNIGNRVTIKIGATAGTQYFNGSIDLNNSYIKIGSTKYNLQAVVGYTVVGSPTITDGVVSGFSSSNYLKSSFVFNSANYTNIEIKLRVKTQSSFTPNSNTYIFNTGTLTAYNSIRIYSGSSSNRLVAFNSTVYYGEASNVNTDTWYNVVFSCNETKQRVEIYNDNNEKIAYSDEENRQIDANDIINFAKNNNAINSIDFNNSYIILDGTKYIFTIGA